MLLEFPGYIQHKLVTSCGAPKGLQGPQPLAADTRGHRRCFWLCSAVPWGSTRGFRGLPLILKLLRILCFSRRHQNAQGFVSPGEPR